VVHGTAIVGTVSGTSISFGCCQYIGVEILHLRLQQHLTLLIEKVVIAYRHDDSNKGKAIVGTVSQVHSISFGSEVNFNNGAETNTYCNSI